MTDTHQEASSEAGAAASSISPGVCWVIGQREAGMQGAVGTSLALA